MDGKDGDGDLKKQTLSTIQSDRKLLQDNMTMRVRYGWALIAILAALVMAVALPSGTVVEDPGNVEGGFAPDNVYALSIILLVVSVTFVFMGLFTSHYGSSYRLFGDDGGLDLDGLLEIERSLHRKTLYKNQLSSLYSGQSLLVAFMGIMVLLISSPYNVTGDVFILAVATCCAFLSGSFLKKRMYRIYQIQRDRLPGLGATSLAGHIIHRVWRRLVVKGPASDQYAKYSGSYRDDNVRELLYGMRYIVPSALILIALSVVETMFQPEAVHILYMLLLGAVAGFVSKQMQMTVTTNIDPSLGDNIASWNPLHMRVLVFRGMTVILLGGALFVDSVCAMSLFLEIVFPLLFLVVLGVFCVIVWHGRDYLRASRLKVGDDGSAEFKLKEGRAVTYAYDRTTGAVFVDAEIRDKHDCIAARLGLEKFLSTIRPEDSVCVTVRLPQGWRLPYERGRGRMEVALKDHEGNEFRSSRHRFFNGH